MSDSVSIDALSWLSGPWRGHLGDDTVEETWSVPANGAMDTSIRLAGQDGVRMLELIVIREQVLDSGKPSLVVHLRQFGPTLDLHNSQELWLESLSDTAVQFTSEPGSSVLGLSYELQESGELKVGVQVSEDLVVYAQLSRP